MLFFLWYAALSYLILFTIISGCIYWYTKEKSFKYYVFYSTFLLAYLSTKDERIYIPLSKIIDSDILLHYNWLIQVVFYSFYFIFALYFSKIFAKGF